MLLRRPEAALRRQFPAAAGGLAGRNSVRVICLRPDPKSTMKAVIILANGTRYTDLEVDEAAIQRRFVEFRPDSQTTKLVAEYFVCLLDGDEDGVPVFRER